MNQKHPYLILTAFIILSFATSALGGMIVYANLQPWYSDLERGPLSPPNWVFPDGFVYPPAGWNLAWLAAGRRRNAPRSNHRLFDKPRSPVSVDSSVFRRPQPASRTGVYAGDICLDAQPVQSTLEAHPPRSGTYPAANPLAHLRRQPQLQRLGAKLVLRDILSFYNPIY